MTDDEQLERELVELDEDVANALAAVDPREVPQAYPTRQPRG